MKIRRPWFRPDPELDRGEMEEMQREIAEEADWSGGLEVEEFSVVAGVDQAFHGDKAVSAAVVLRDGEVVERVDAVTEVEVPYVPGLLAYREGAAAAAALQRLELTPDAVLFDGSGRIHYRQAGLATHVGVLFDAHAVGVAKNLLCGYPVDEVDGLQEGERVRVEADGDVEAPAETTLGYAFQGKQDSSGRINPLYVSPGHRLDAETAVSLVESTVSAYKLPEPVRLADEHADDVKEEVVRDS